VFARVLSRLEARIAATSRAADDSDALRLQKVLLVSIAVMIAVAAIVWGLIYVAFGEYLPGSIPLFYSVVSTLSIAHFLWTGRYRFFRFSQLLLILILPFLLMLSLGGFINSSAVVLWSILSPLGALIFVSNHQAWWWFVAYLGLDVLSGVLQPFIRTTNNLDAWVVLMFFVMNIGAVSFIGFFMLSYFVRQKDTFFELLKVEQEKSERLLLNVLPREIAPILKDNTDTIANYHESVSILFADVVGFTPLSVELTPTEMVELLNTVFTYFDTLTEKYTAEKIRTIGDNYMVIAGAPRPCPNHAHQLARMALDMIAYVDSDKNPARGRLRFRVGINSGPVVAGVIGKSKFQYDVWGDAVNTASRMESHGEPGKIQIGRGTLELIRDDFICTPRGVLDIKGKGRMETWFLEKER
jgi:guanylate cyclase